MATNATRIAQALLNEPPLDLTVKDDAQGAGSRRTGAARDADRQRAPRRQTRVRASALPGFADGAWWVQDAAAALPAKLLGDVRGKRVLDLCAAPGGKTLQLAAAGAHVTAVDKSERG